MGVGSSKWLRLECMYLAMVCGRCGLCFGAIAAVPVAVIISALVETPVRTPFAWDQVPHKAEREFGIRPEHERALKTDATEATAAFGSGKMFDKIAFAYDHGNRWMSLGLDQFWRQTLLNELWGSILARRCPEEVWKK